MDSTSPTLGALVLDQPRAAELFEELGLDFCCGGRRTLEVACREAEIDPVAVAARLRALADAPAEAGPGQHDVGGLSITALCDHVVAEHHDPLRRELPRIAALLDTVVRVHGDTHPELARMRATFTDMTSELERHLVLEESAVFPVCRRLDAGTRPDGGQDEVLALLEDDHDDVGAALATLRRLGRGYDLDAALCGTHRRLLSGLSTLERDMHQHVHEENNVLFPRVRDRLAACA